MPYELDPEIATALDGLSKEGATLRQAARGDWQTLRENGNAVQTRIAKNIAMPEDVQKSSFFVESFDASPLELRLYIKTDSQPGSAVVYAHGGGMIFGELDMYDSVIGEYVSRTGVPFLAVQYRLAPDVKGTTLVEDLFAGFVWLSKNAEGLDIDPKRIALMGDSAGAGITAGAAILARYRKMSLARQILIYPMLDDRNIIANRHLTKLATWSYDNNFTGWSALLGDELGGESVSPVIAPARLENCEGLAAAYIEVGELDIFRDEDIAYATKLAQAGVPVELHVHPGAVHGFDRIAPWAKVSERAMLDRVRIIKSI